MALAKKDKIWISIISVLTVVILAITITLGILLRPAPEGTNDNGAIDSEQPNNEPIYKPIAYDELLNFQGYNKKASDLLVELWKQNELWKNIDFSNDSAADIVNHAINNTNLATQRVSFIITESDVFGSEGSVLADMKFKNTSTYLSGVADGMNYTQTISHPQQLKLGGIDGSNLLSKFDYVVRTFNNGQKQTGKNVYFQTGTKYGKPVNVPAGALADWDEPIIEQADYDSDYVTTVEDETSWTRYKRNRTQNGKFLVYDPVTREWMGTIKLSDGEQVPIWGSYTYQIDESVLDAEASKASIENHGDYYTVKLIYKDEPADYKYTAADGTPLYDSVIDQACRYAAASLASNLLNVGVLTVDTIRYSKLTMTYEIWNTGLLKSMTREETMTANITALDMYSSHCVTNNTAHEVYSYNDIDTIDYITAKYKEAGATK